MSSTTDRNRAAATRFIEVFNTNDWDVLPEVVGRAFVLHHPMGGTMELGPGGMKAVWSHFKAALPDAWHPIPIMITEGDYLANLLPTYGTFDGEPHQGIPPTGGWLEYGMVNIVRFEDGKLAEGWFGMDPLVEMQQMGAAPSGPARVLTDSERANLELFGDLVKPKEAGYDTVTAFGDVIVAMGPPQFSHEAKSRKLEIYRRENGKLTLTSTHEFPTIPPFEGSLGCDTDASRSVVTAFVERVLCDHDLSALAELTSAELLIHPTAMPCEAGFYGLGGAEGWLEQLWVAFPDLTVTEYHTVASGDIVAARWRARGTSKGRFVMLSPTGDPVEFTGVSMYRIEDGRIAEIWDTRNTLGIMMQLNPALAEGHGQ